MINDMLADMPAERMWALPDDRKTMRLRLPPLPIAGMPVPLSIHLYFDAAMLEIRQRLSVLRAWMFPGPPRN